MGTLDMTMGLAPLSNPVTLPIFDNFSIFTDTAYKDVLHYAVDVLLKKDVYALFSESDRINSIQSILSSNNCDSHSEKEKAECNGELGDMLVDYELFETAFFFYFQTYQYCRQNHSCKSAAARCAILQIGKLLTNNLLDAPKSVQSQLAAEIFEWLVKECNCYEAALYLYDDV